MLGHQFHPPPHVKKSKIWWFILHILVVASPRCRAWALSVMRIYFGVDACQCDDSASIPEVWEFCLAAPPGVAERAAVLFPHHPAPLLKCILIVCNTVSGGSQAFTGEVRFHAASFQYPQTPIPSLPPPCLFFFPLFPEQWRSAKVHISKRQYLTALWKK